MEGGITSKDLSIGNLFDEFYVIPNYQREFVWTEEQVKKLVDDIYAEFVSGGDQHQIEYFVGSMVVCARDDGSSKVYRHVGKLCRICVDDFISCAGVERELVQNLSTYIREV